MMLPFFQKCLIDPIFLSTCLAGIELQDYGIRNLAQAAISLKSISKSRQIIEKLTLQYPLILAYAALRILV